MSQITEVAASATAEASKVEAAVTAARDTVAATVAADETKAVAFWNQYRVFAIVASVLLVAAVVFVGRACSHVAHVS